LSMANTLLSVSSWSMVLEVMHGLRSASECPA
jgi:hypothetical protein